MVASIATPSLVKITIIVEELPEDGKITELIFHRLQPQSEDAIQLSVDTESLENPLRSRVKADQVPPVKSHYITFKINRILMLAKDSGKPLYDVVVRRKGE